MQNSISSKHKQMVQSFLLDNTFDIYGGQDEQYEENYRKRSSIKFQFLQELSILPLKTINNDTTGQSIRSSSIVQKPSATQHPQKQSITKIKPKRIEYRNKNYDPLNLTQTIQGIALPKRVFVIMFFLSIAVRIWTIAYLLFVFQLEFRLHHYRLIWIVPLVFSRFLYIVLVLKVSLSMASGPVESILKNVWCPFESTNEYFDRITTTKFLGCLEKALIPPELSYCYLSKQNKNKRFITFTIINYIYLSIEVILFYTFLIIYCIQFLSKDKDLLAYKIYTYMTVVIVLGWMTVFWIFSLYLLIRGIIMRYQKIQ